MIIVLFAKIDFYPDSFLLPIKNMMNAFVSTWLKFIFGKSNEYVRC